MSDAVVVTDLDRRVVFWNDAAADLYGITAGEALGRAIDTLYDTTVIGEGTTWSGARAMASTRGVARPDRRPAAGREEGRPRTDHRDRPRPHRRRRWPAARRPERPARRDDGRAHRARTRPPRLAGGHGGVTPGPRPTRGRRSTSSPRSWASASRRSSSRTATERRVLATQGGHDKVLSTVIGVVWRDSPLVRAVSPVGRVVKGLVDRLPLRRPSDARCSTAGSGRWSCVGLHQDDALVGVLCLGWATDDPAIPSDATVLLIAPTSPRAWPMPASWRSSSVAPMPSGRRARACGRSTN